MTRHNYKDKRTRKPEVKAEGIKSMRLIFERGLKEKGFDPKTFKKTEPWKVGVG